LESLNVAMNCDDSAGQATALRQRLSRLYLQGVRSRHLASCEAGQAHNATKQPATPAAAVGWETGVTEPPFLQLLKLIKWPGYNY